MELPISLRSFEAAMVRSCAPVLFRVKPANLFTFRGRFVSDCPACSKERCRTLDAPAEQADPCASRRRALSQVVERFDNLLSGEGMRCRVIAWRPFGALVYAYRPSLVERHMGDPAITRDLAQLGYPVHAGRRRADGGDSARSHSDPFGQILDEERVSICIEHLARRFDEQAVPHEVGYFLGYPAADVQGFIAHEGRAFLCCGCWKVYSDVRGAQYRFARYKRCTRRARALYDAGASLLDLARDPVGNRVA